MTLSQPASNRPDERQDKVRRFRQMYLDGTLSRVLIPKDADWTALLRDVFAGGEPPRR
jgi:hypothetical protein